MCCRRFVAEVGARILFILFNISQCIWMSSAIFHKVAGSLCRRCHVETLCYTYNITQVTRWGFGGGLAAPRKLLLRRCEATSSPHTGEKRVSWRAASPPNLPARNDRVTRATLVSKS